jgi:5'-3' exoribonuclease 1
MGVPLLYREIITNYPHVVKSSDEVTNVHYFLIDFNGIIHWAITKAEIDEEDKSKRLGSKYKKPTNTEHENRIIFYLDKRTQQIIDTVNPVKGIGIFVDGPAPRPKMVQQLQRRIKGPMEARFKNDIKKDLGIPLWEIGWRRDRATPGTTFMSEIIENYINSLPKIEKYKNLEIIISGCNEAGEGEHKLFNYIKRHLHNLKVDIENPDNTQKIAVCGLDGDLIMLSMASQLQNIYLFRESTEFNMIGSENDFKYLDCFEFRVSMLTELRNKIKSIDPSALCIKQKQDAIIDDYVFMFFLLGNDFVPHPPTLSIKNGGMDKLIQLYTTVFDEFQEHLVTITDRHNPDKTQTRVNIKPVRKLIQLLAQTENEDMQDIYDSRIKLSYRFPKIRKDNPTELDVLYHQLYYLPVLKIKDELELRIDGLSGWMQKYYNHLLRLKRTRENINMVCQNYLEMLDWILSYYYTESHSWGHWYRYTGAPLFQDLAFYMAKLEAFPTEPLEQRKMTSYSAYEQLLMVLPKSSYDLLPEPLGKYMIDPKSPIVQYYPEKFKVNLLFNMCFWETQPIVPPINDKEITTIVSQTKLSDRELSRNTSSKLIVVPPRK